MDREWYFLLQLKFQILNEYYFFLLFQKNRVGRARKPKDQLGVALTGKNIHGKLYMGEEYMERPFYSISSW